MIKDRFPVVSRWVCDFMLREERILWCFHVVSCRVKVCDAWELNFIGWKTPEPHKLCCVLSHGVD